MLSITITVFISNKIIIAVDNRAGGVETVCLNSSVLFIRVSWSCRADALFSVQHNVLKFLEVGILAEGGDDSAQDIHQPSNRDVHFWQKYYSIFAETYSNNIQKTLNREPPTHAHTSDTRTHNDTGRGFYYLSEINLFISPTAPSTFNIKFISTRA